MNLNLYAIFAGAAADMFGTLMVTLMISTIAQGVLLSQGVPEAEIGARLARDGTVLLWSVVAGLAASAVGGFVAARIARFRELTHGASAGAVGLVLSTVSAVLAPTTLPTWYIVTGYGLVVPAAALGGWLGKLWNDKTAASKPPE
jgi:hypothetical protein